MADKRISDLPIQAADSGTRWLQVLKPDAGSPTGFTNYRMTRDSFLEEITDEITIIQDDVNDNTTDIENQQKYLFKDTYLVSNTFTFSQVGFSVIREMYISTAGVTSGIIKIGTTLNGDEILTERTVADGDILALDYMLAIKSSRTIYVTKSGGDLNLEIFSRKLTL